MSRTGSMPRWYLTCTGICWSPTLNTQSRSGGARRYGLVEFFMYLGLYSASFSGPAVAQHAVWTTGLTLNAEFAATATEAE